MDCRYNRNGVIDAVDKILGEIKERALYRYLTRGEDEDKVVYNIIEELGTEIIEVGGHIIREEHK